jgi:hypothetical protein
VDEIALVRVDSSSRVAAEFISKARKRWERPATAKPRRGDSPVEGVSPKISSTKTHRHLKRKRHGIPPGA